MNEYKLTFSPDTPDAVSVIVCVKMTVKTA